MKNFYWFLLCCFSAHLCAQSPGFNWAKSYGGLGHTEAHYMAVDSVGNVYSAGPFTTGTDFDPGPGVYSLTTQGFSDLFISKIDSAGNFQWAVAITGTVPLAGAEYLTRIALDKSGNLYVSGYCPPGTDLDPGPATLTLASTYDQSFLLKLNSAGSLVWAKVFSGTAPNTEVRTTVMEIDQNGNIYMGGSHSGVADFDPGAGTYTMAAPSNNLPDTYLLKLDASGNFIWAKSLPCNNGGMLMQSIAVDNSGNICSTGLFSGTVDLDPGTGVYTATTSATNNWDIFILKLDASGNFVWANLYGANLNDFGKAVKIDEQNNLYVTGAFQGIVDFDAGPSTYTLSSAGNFYAFIMKLNPAGSLVWVRQYGGAYIAPEGRYMAMDKNKNIYLTGNFSYTTNLDPGASNYTVSGSQINAYVAKYDSVGHFLWGSAVGKNSYSRGYDVALGPEGCLYLTGTFQADSSDFDPTAGTATLSSGTSTNSAYLVKLNQHCSSTLTVTANQPSVICAGENLVLNTGGPGKFTWYADAALTQTLGTTASYTSPSLAAGDYSYYVKNINPSCAMATASLSLKVTQCTGIAELQVPEELMSVYPNPSAGLVTLFYPSFSPGEGIKVTNGIGMEVLSLQVSQSHTQIDLQKQPQGIYFIQLRNSKKVQKAIKVTKTEN